MYRSIAQKEEAYNSGWVDQPGDYLNQMTFSARTPTRVRRLGLFNLLEMTGPNSERGGQATCHVSEPQNPDTDIPNYLYQVSMNTDLPVPSSTQTVTSSTGKSILYPTAAQGTYSDNEH